MDLASGYSDSTNYGNGYTPLANNAINNNNADYLRNQLAVQQAGQYDPFAQSGGFGAQTAYYAGLGADYGRAVGGGGNIYAPSGGPASNTATMFDGMSPADMATWQQQMYAAGKGSEIPGGMGGIGSDAARAPNQPALTPQQYYAGGYDPYASSSFGPSVQKNVGSAGQGNAPYQFPGMDKIQPQPTDYSQIPSGIFDGNFRQQPQGNTATMFDGMSSADMAAWQQQMYKAGKGSEIPPFWQGVRNATGMGQPGGGGYDPYAGLGNQGQPGVTDPMGYGSGGYQGNAIPNWTQPQPQQQQPNSLPPFWQGVRDIFGADPKDQSRVPQSDGGYPGMTNPNYQPGGMTPQPPWQGWQEGH